MRKRLLTTKHGTNFRARWTDESGKRQSKCFPSREDAERFILQQRLEVQDIKSGLRSRILSEKSYLNLCDYYLENVAPMKKSQKDLISIINTHLRPYFGKFRIKDITQESVNEFIKLKSTNGATAKTISNHLTLFITMLNLAKDMRWISEVPRIRKPKVTNSHTFTYLKTKDEIQRFLRGAKSVGELPYVLYATATFTGLRQGELAGLRWEDINFETRIITVQRSFHSTTKNECVRYVPILDSLLPILIEWKTKAINEIVFSSCAGKIFHPSARIFQEVFKAILTKAEFPKIIKAGKQRHYIRFHDLRHTFASHFMMGGGNIYKLKNILGHSSIEMTMRYAHLSQHIYVEDYSRFNGISL